MTSKEQLRSIINQCCDKLRTDDGISGSVHYTEELSWILYLKFFSDKERERKAIAELEGEEYHPFIKKEFQWDSWSDPKKGKTGKELIAFVKDGGSAFHGARFSRLSWGPGSGIRVLHGVLIS